ncbi:Hypothetical predicted protein [Mytilus galloprovincialis]|uniref:SCAN box domain-containing protein n=1 Tax=Mytilus galloprovincialis TaxID=29158 RepID=A0A8B6EWG3_MYTGA|nr:Hypothetical predicted protein [Mytilus galloprovincialis]
MAFDAGKFLKTPDLEGFDNLKKEELVLLAKHLKLDFKVSMRKQIIKNLVIDKLVDAEILGEEALELKVENVDAFKLKQLELEHELKLKELEMKRWRNKIKELEMKERVRPLKYTPALPSEKSSDYDTVKQEVLKAYELVPEAYRQKFRSYKKFDSQTYVEFAREKEDLFDKWLTSKKTDNNFDNLRQLMLLEEFKQCVHLDLKTHLDDKTVGTIHDAAVISDNYTLSHKRSFKGQNVNTSSGNYKNQSTERTDNSRRRMNEIISRSPVLVRHLILPVRWNVLRVRLLSPVFCDYMEEYKPFMSDGFISIVDDTTLQPIKILRDTGASQSLLLEGVLPLSEKTSVGASVLLQGVELGCIDVPLHRIYLKSDLITGPVIVGVRPNLPVEGVTLLLGNDLARNKVVAEPIVTSEPVVDVKLPEDDAELYPACVVLGRWLENNKMRICKKTSLITWTFLTLS